MGHALSDLLHVSIAGTTIGICSGRILDLVMRLIGRHDVFCIDA